MMKEKLCSAKRKLLAFYVRLDEAVLQQFGFHIQDATLDNIVNYLYKPKDSSSLAITRILFGLAMLFDIPDERGGALMDDRWGDPLTCHFPLIPFVRAVPMPYMALVYAALWFGALGISLGYKYRASAAMFTCCYWYLLLIDKSYWNNHSYLFGLVALLLAFTDAHCYWSIDAILEPSLRSETVPYWNYFILKYQFFILYFMAGLKKGSAEWLTGYSVQNLSEHWVFSPFKMFLTVEQTDYLVVHWFVFAFDLTVAFWMMWARTRHLATFFCAIFHLMNSRLFSIGMFPWVCLATMPLFYPFDWPKTVGDFVKYNVSWVKTEACRYWRYLFHDENSKCDEPSVNGEDECKKTDSNDVDKEHLNGCTEKIIEETVHNEHDKEKDDSINDFVDHNNEMKSPESPNEEIDKNIETLITKSDSKEKLTDPLEKKKKHVKMLTVTLIFFHVITQAFLPFSHFITKGFNNWTNGLYGYSWDMMVHTWDTDSVVVKIVDNEKQSEFYIDPYVYAPNGRWTRHGDMLYQYAECLKDNLMLQSKKFNGKSTALSNNISIYIDIWCSMNGRFTQRMFDPKVDLLAVSWSVFEPVSYLMPLLDEALSWRSVLQDIKQEVHSWHNASDVIFIADFPGYDQEKYIPTDLSNVTLNVLEGSVVYEPELSSSLDGQSYQLSKGSPISLEPGTLHKVINIGEKAAYYMYTFVNTSDVLVADDKYPIKLPITREMLRRANNMAIFTHIVIANVLETLLRLTQCY